MELFWQMVFSMIQNVEYANNSCDDACTPMFYHICVVMLFHSKTSILYYFCTSLVYYIIQNVLSNKKIENWIFI